MILLSREQSLRSKTDETGFTLVELLIALVVSGLVMAAVVSVYTVQSRSYSERDDLANVQQDLRGVLTILPMEIRLAGCDPLESHVPKILTATSTNFRFTMDTKDVGSPRTNNPDRLVTGDEDIAYNFAAGVPPAAGVLGRQIDNAGGFQPLAANIEAMEFNYILADGTTSLAPSDPNKIRAVQVSILARTVTRTQGFLNATPYRSASGAAWGPYNDNFRRRLVVTTIQCRNMGL